MNSPSLLIGREKKSKICSLDAIFYANEQIRQSDWSRAFLMRCILFLIGYGTGLPPLLLVTFNIFEDNKFHADVKSLLQNKRALFKVVSAKIKGLFEARTILHDEVDATV